VSNKKLTGMRQMEAGVTSSRHHSGRVRLDGRFRDVDVVDVVLGARRTELAAMDGDAALEPAAADGDDEHHRRRDDDDDRQDRQQLVERATTGELDGTDGERQPP